MKFNFKQVILPLVVVGMATAAAFATNAVKSNSLATPSEWGYVYNHQKQECEYKMDCSEVPGAICTYLDQQVFGVNRFDELGQPILSECSVLLYKPLN
ncbi:MULTISPECIES: DUF6520 family protein [Myroides]|uniref:Secreted protein n=2 Tax=Myroides TaxID=76831 RepID=A0A9Q6Z5L1_MYROD|nr:MULTISPECIES: DUF6520 family protein [Myroides]EHQ44280.1 hypothetical protein Myrod_3482 [Myroides odoratus DSM 2801]EKB03022.1 hypothetical protein HMPREF9716_03634 [Myroides odoratus CIP 103059]MTG98797.1 hypothetical protein [Myroides albus]QQU01556.1 hypothetical protein I6I88_07420 [Myroides odoratus]WQD56165.1 DUF6520 family protein [Myroides odoratus]